MLTMKKKDIEKVITRNLLADIGLFQKQLPKLQIAEIENMHIRLEKPCYEGASIYNYHGAANFKIIDKNAEPNIQTQTYSFSGACYVREIEGKGPEVSNVQTEGMKQETLTFLHTWED